MLCKLLRGDIAVRVQALDKAAIVTDVVQRGAEIREVVIAGDFFVEPVRLGKLDGLVERHLGLRGPQFECRVPGTAIRPVEAAAERMRMAERGVHDAEIGYAENELVNADSGESAALRQQSVV